MRREKIELVPTICATLLTLKVFKPHLSHAFSSHEFDLAGEGFDCFKCGSFRDPANVYVEKPLHSLFRLCPGQEADVYLHGLMRKSRAGNTFGRSTVAIAHAK